MIVQRGLLGARVWQDLIVRGTPKDKQNTAKMKLNGKFNTFCSREVEVAQHLHLLPCSLVFSLLLCSLSLLLVSLLTVWAFFACCHGYSWSLMHSVTFLWDQLILCQPGCVCVSLCVGGWVGIFLIYEGERKWKGIIEKLIWLLNFFFLLFPSPVPLRPPAASWRLWSSTWPPLRAKRLRSWMQTPGRYYTAQ